MIKNWITYQLQEVTSKIGSGATPKGGKKAYKTEGISLIRSLNVHDDLFKVKDLAYIDKEQAEKLSNVVVEKGDVLLNITGASIARCCIAPVEHLPARVNQHVSILRPKLDVLDSVFLARLLIAKENKDHLLNTGEKAGATRQALTKTQLQEFKVTIPPLPEQKRIVTILDDAFARIDAAIANTEKNIVNTRELFESYLNGVFEQKGDGWEDTCVEKLCDSIIDCINKTAPKVDEETPFKMLRTTNIRNGLVNINHVKHVTEEVYHAWTRRQIPAYGDVLLTREAPMGEVGILLTDEKVFLGQRIVSYRVNSTKLDNRFLLYAFQSSFLQQQMNKVASGSTVQHIRVPDTKKWIIPTPSLEQQAIIADNLDRLKEKKQNIECLYQQKLTALHELKQSILHKAFSGELTADMNFDEQVA